MKKTDIAAGFLLALAVGVAWLVIMRPPWVFNLGRESRRWFGNEAKEALTKPINHGSPELRLNALNARAKLAGATAPQGPIFAIRDSDSREPVTSFEFQTFPDSPDPEALDAVGGWKAISHERGFLRLHDIVGEGAGDVAVAPKDDVLVIRADGYAPEKVLISKLVMDWRTNPAVAPRILLYRIGERPLARMETEFDSVMRKAARMRKRAGIAEVNIVGSGLGELATLAGTVHIHGRPASAGQVSIGLSAQNVAFSGDIGGDGRYAIGGITAGSYSVRVRAASDSTHWREHSQPLRLGAGEQAQFDYDFPAIGTVRGVVSGLEAGETGGVFAIKGDQQLGNVTEDDLYDFGDIAEGEGQVGKDGGYTIEELDAGRYTLVAIAQHFGESEVDRAFWYVTGSVDIPADGEVIRDMSFVTPASGQN